MHRLHYSATYLGIYCLIVFLSIVIEADDQSAEDEVGDKIQDVIAELPPEDMKKAEKMPAFGSSELAKIVLTKRFETLKDKIKCPINEELNSCGESCDKNCSTPVACGNTCTKPSCVCKEGYARLPIDGATDCVPETECPWLDEPERTFSESFLGSYYYDADAFVQSLACLENEEVNYCGNLCEMKCGSLQLICPLICKPPACTCSENFARSRDGKCVPVADCESHSEKSRSARFSRSTQDTELGDVDTTNTSIPSNEVNLKCGLNEELNPCGSQCEPTCDNPGPVICMMTCFPPACECKADYSRLSGAGATCILTSECPNSGAVDPEIPKNDVL